MEIFLLTNRPVKDDPAAEIIFDQQPAGLNFRAGKLIFDDAELESIDHMSDLVLQIQKINQAYAKASLKSPGIHLELYPDTLTRDVKYNAESLEDLKTHAGSAALFSDLYTSMQADSENNRRDTLFFIHGFANNEADLVMNALKLHYAYRKHGNIKNILILSWPTNGGFLALPGNGLNWKQYWNDAMDARTTGGMLARVYVKLVDFLNEYISEDKDSRKPCGSKIHLLVHSMGHQVLNEMLAVAEAEDLYKSPLFQEAICVAADIENDALNRGKPLFQLGWLSKRITLYINKNDHVLDISQYTKHKKQSRLGENGPATLSDLPGNVTLVDVTGSRDLAGKTKDKVLNHWYHFSSEPVIHDIQNVLRGIPSESSQLSRMYITHRNTFKLNS